MADKVRIRVRLTPEGSAILGGAEWATLDLQPGFSLRGYKDIAALSDINEITTDGVLAFSVPLSTTNNAAFLCSDSPSITDNREQGIECRIFEGAHEWPFDTIWVNGKSESGTSWELEARRSPNHWLELASNKRLNTIDLGEETVDTDLISELANQTYIDGGAVSRWFPVDYGDWVDLAEPVQFTDPPLKTVWMEDLRPWFSLPNLLKQGFCEIGWTLEGQILSSPWALAQWCYILDRLYYKESRGGLHKIIGQQVGFDNMIAQFIYAPIVFDTLQYDPGSNEVPVGPVWASGITNSLPFKARYRMTYNGYVENTSLTVTTVTFLISDFNLVTGLPDGQIFWQEDFELGASEKRYLTIDQEVDIEPGVRVSFLIQTAGSAIKLPKGYRIIVEPANKSLVRGDVVTLNKLISRDYFLLDVFKGFLHECGGRIETIWETRTVVVHPYRTTEVAGDSIPGFIKDGEAAIDISGKLLSSSIRSTRTKKTLNRYTRLSFAESSDAYIESLNLSEPPFSRKVLNGIDLPDQVTELENPFFEPTMEGQPDTLKKAKNITQVNHPMPYLPRLWDNTEGNRSFVIGPRLLFFFGEVSQYDSTSGLLTSFFFEDTTATQVFGYASQKPTLPIDSSTPPGVSFELVYGTASSDLYVSFYLGLLQQAKNAFMLNALVMTNPSDFVEWDFRTRFAFVYQGRPLLALAQKITDYGAGSGTPTPIDFVVEPSETSCCDLPCSCSFTECDFYQDLGQFVSQNTLDSLTITSFKVNGIERLDSGIDLGILHLVELSGRPFVMNLVDALNALAIDYFTFRPSTQIYEDKEDLRFFKIKWPTCWSFEIIVSDGEAEVYRYRNNEQAQQWFDETWEGFGYDNEFTEPNECVTTIEY